MSKKDILIGALRGKISVIEDIGDLFEGFSIYDETGHVDTDLLEEMLKFGHQLIKAELSLQTKINEFLMPDFIDDDKSGKTDDGEILSTEEILKRCTLENNVIKLPNIKLEKKSYLEAKRYIEEAGGKWTGGKIQGFSFEYDAKRVFEILHEGQRCKLQKEFQYFSTPDVIADMLVKMSSVNVSKGIRILEPSAGTGSIVKAIYRRYSCNVDCYELMPENREILSRLDYAIIKGDDFTKECTDKYDLIIANPPFSKNQDIDHIRLMYDHLDEKGELIAISGPHWKIGQEQKCVDFIAWIKKVNATVTELEPGTFKGSGTNVTTNVIYIKK